MKKIFLLVFTIGFFVYSFTYFNSMTTASAEDLIGKTYDNAEYSIAFDDEKITIKKKSDSFEIEQYYSKLSTEDDSYKFHLKDSIFELTKMSEGFLSDADGEIYLKVS